MRNTTRAALIAATCASATPAFAQDYAPTRFCQIHSSELLTQMQAMFEPRTRLLGITPIDLDNITTIAADFENNRYKCHMTVQFNTGIEIAGTYSETPSKAQAGQQLAKWKADSE